MTRRDGRGTGRLRTMDSLRTMIGQLGTIFQQRWPFFLAACLLLCAVGGLVIFLQIRRSRKRNVPFVTLDEGVQPGAGMPGQKQQGAMEGSFGMPGGTGAESQSVRWMADDLLDPISRRIREYPETDLKSYQLILQDLARPGQVYRANVAERITIGRRAGCTIQIPDRTMSGEHCEILLRGGKLYIRDLQSTNGTYLGRSTSRADMEELKTGDVIRMGSVRMRVQIAVISP